MTSAHGGQQVRVWVACFLLLPVTGSLAQAQTVTVPADQTAKGVWVAAADYSLQNNKDYGSIVLAASLNAFYKTYPNATAAQAQEVVSAIQTRLTGIPKTEYVFGHQTQEDLVHAAFNIVGDTSLPPAAKVSLTFGKEAYDLLRREYNALLDEQAKVAAETTLDIGFRKAADSAFVQKQLEQLYDRAKADPTKAAVIDGALGSKVGCATSATVASCLQSNPAFQQFTSVQYILSHMLTNGEFQDGMTNLRTEFVNMLNNLKAEVGDDVIPLLESMNQTQLQTYETLVDYVNDVQARQAAQQIAEQKRQAQELKLQAAQSGVYLLSTFAGFVNPQVGRTLNVVGNTAIQVNQAIANFSTAASSVDTSLIGSKFTGAQLGGVILAGNLVGAAMQIASLFENAGPSPDQIILDQIVQLRQQIAQLQTIMIARFDRIDSQLNQISGSIDTVLLQLGQIGVDLVQVQTQLFSLQSQVSRLEIEIHQWLSNSDRIPLLTGINNALGYEKRNGRRMSLTEFLNYESLFYTWATFVVKDTTRAGPDFSTSIVMADQLKFPLSSNINYFAQMISQFLGFPRIVPVGTRLASPNDWLFSASAYYRLFQENQDYVAQLPGALSRLRDVSSAGKQLKSSLDGMVNRDLFLDASKGLVARYKRKRDALKSAISDYRETQFLPANTCGGGSFDGCIPLGVDFWQNSSFITSYRPSISTMNACDGTHNYPLSVPGNDILYAVPAALLDADRRLGNQISICFDAHFEWSPPPYNGYGTVFVDIRARYRSLVIATMSKGVYGCGSPTLCSTPSADPWWVIATYTVPNWNTFKNNWNYHPGIILSVAPWAAQLYQTLTTKRSQFYNGVVLEFPKTTGGIGQAALDLNAAKTLLMGFHELGTPRTLQGNDYLRSMLYGNQRLYTGFDPINGVDIRSLYASAGSTTPELDIVPVIDKRINAVSSVLTQVFAQIGAAQLTEANSQVDSTARKLDDFAYALNEAQCATMTLASSSITLGNATSTGGASGTVSISAANTCSWTVTTTLPFVNITSPPAGSGSGFVNFIVLPNTGADRVATLSIGGKTFVIHQTGTSKIGVFRAGLWILDGNGNGQWDGTPQDRVNWLGQAADVAVLGDWSGDGKTKIGFFRNGMWLLDYNGNGQWDGPTIDRLYWLGQAGDSPLVGDWNGDGKTKIGFFRSGMWLLDYNGDGGWNGPDGDRLYYLGQAGDTPVVGDWSGDGAPKIGFFRNGMWLLDYNGNGQWDGPAIDRLYWMGQAGDSPMVGDWNQDGRTKIGFFRNGMWLLDHNGDGGWNGPSVDKLYYLGQAGDIPLIGDWNGDGRAKVGFFRSGMWLLDHNGNGGWDGPILDRLNWLGQVGDRPVVGGW